MEATSISAITFIAKVEYQITAGGQCFITQQINGELFT
jgi:hypothetical protein